ncbi:response regulator transcription factor [Streptomyces lavendulae]|nr:LuxR C-terminal-related transcriptional regulator [Streptomyces lavendulae]TXJ85212.1 response regulator transcription factor [Streptomyces lavendulae]
MSNTTLKKIEVADVKPEDADPERVYALAARQRHVQLSGLSQTLGWNGERTAAAVEKLCRYNLLVPVHQDGETFSVSTPRHAASRLLAPLDRQIESLEREAFRLRADLGKYQDTYTEAVAGSDRNLEFVTLVGHDAINAELELAAARCEEEVLTAQPGGGRSAESLKSAWTATKDMLDRGIRMRTVYQHSARFSPATRRYVNQVTEYGGQVRSLEQITERLIIFDRKVAFIPARSDRKAALAVYQPAVVEFLVGIFERAWILGTPFPSRNRAPDVQVLLSDVRLSIIKLLADGETDETIARRMGLSVRTCRSHISKMYETFGVRSRCQLGVFIANSGLLDAGTVDMVGEDAS